jgi:hypothetical protein
MNESEIMDVVELEPVQDNAGMSTGTAIAIGVGAAAATYAVVKLVKKAVTAIKKKKANRQANDDYVEVEAVEE